MTLHWRAKSPNHSSPDGTGKSAFVDRSEELLDDGQTGSQLFKTGGCKSEAKQKHCDDIEKEVAVPQDPTEVANTRDSWRVSQQSKLPGALLVWNQPHDFSGSVSVRRAGAATTLRRMLSSRTCPGVWRSELRPDQVGIGRPVR